MLFCAGLVACHYLTHNRGRNSENNSRDCACTRRVTAAEAEARTEREPLHSARLPQLSRSFCLHFAGLSMPIVCFSGTNSHARVCVCMLVNGNSIKPNSIIEIEIPLRSGAHTDPGDKNNQSNPHTNSVKLIWPHAHRRNRPVDHANMIWQLP